MKRIIVLLFVFVAIQLQAQLSRYPYIQSTTTTSTIIAWKTDANTTGSVSYGLDVNNMDMSVAEPDPTQRHGLTLRNLTPDTEYFYEIFADGASLAQESFFTASDSTDDVFSFIHYGDCGYNNSMQNQIGDLMEADDASFAVVCGDIDQGGVPHFSSGDGGDDYDEIYFDVYNDGVESKMLSHECHYTALGNHDTYKDNAATYLEEFYLPHNNMEGSERYYSFEWGDALFIALDVVTPFDPTAFPINQADLEDRWWTDFREGSLQYQFLEEQLQCNDKQWVFIYFHEAPWTNYWGADYYVPEAIGGDYYLFEGNEMVRDELVPLFEEYAVDFVLCGHSHLYEQAEKNGVMYITSGSAGDGDVSANIEYANHPEITKAILDNVYLKYEVNGNTTSYDVINKDNTIIDTFSRTKTYTEYEVNAAIANPTCYNGVDGEIVLSVQGPKPPYTIEWGDGTLGNTLSGQSAGTYYAFIRNNFGCEKVSSFTIENPEEVIPVIVSSTGNNVVCEDGLLELTVSTPYSSYMWSTGDETMTTLIAGAGDVSVTVEDVNGCQGTSIMYNVVEQELPDADFSFAFSQLDFNFLCFDENIDTYAWDFGDGNTSVETENLVGYSFANVGIYEVTLIATNNCGADTLVQSVQVGSVGINDIENLYGLTISPNPLQEKAIISVPEMKGKLNVSLYNNIGEIVAQFKTKKSTFEIDASLFPKGNYVVKIVGAGNKETAGQFIVY
ncbi:MAG: PKD domain-containing protein [Chitinophagales bacterium]